MPVLRYLADDAQESHFELGEGPVTIGRQPGCAIVLDKVAVSRQHAQITFDSPHYYLEDLQSRNGTQINDVLAHGRMKLRDRDQIKICDARFIFYRNMNASQLKEFLAGGGRHQPTPQFDLKFSDERDIESSSSIISTLNAMRSDSFQLNADPQMVLKAILEISEALSKILDTDKLLPRILAVLFKIFPNAESGFFLLQDPVTQTNQVRAVRHRHPRDDDNLPISKTIIDKAMESGTAILSADVNDDSRFRESASISEIMVRSIMCVPLMSHSGKAIGVIQLNSQNLETEFTKSDLELLVSVGFQVSLAFENVRLHEELISQRDLERDIEFATQIQLGFLPRERPMIPDYDFADLYEAALGVGGDYYDYIPLPDGRLAIAQGDVSGKGVPAALLMARLCSAVRYQLLAQPSIALALHALNREISVSGVGFRFITFVLLILDPIKHRLEIANAGHLPPLLKRKHGEIFGLGEKITGLPLGIMPETQYEQQFYDLMPGDLVVLYTDGVTEAMDDCEQIFGRTRLEECLDRIQAGPQEAIREIVESTNRYSNNQPLRDDRCLVAFRCQAGLNLDGSTLF